MQNPYRFLAPSQRLQVKVIILAYVLAVTLSGVPVPAVTPIVSAAAPTCDVTLNSGDSIQAAITAASTGDVICLNPGNYPQASTITVDEEVTITRTGCDADVIESRTAGSASEAIIDGGGSIATILDLQADNITLQCLEVKSATGDMIESQSGIPTSGIVIKNNIIHNATGDEAVQLRKSTNALIQYNHIYDVAQDAVNVSDNSTGAEIRDNKIHDSNSSNGAIYIYGNTTNTTIDGNLIYNKTNNDTVRFGNSGADEAVSGGSITNNIIVTGSQDAISVVMSDVTVSGNKISTHASSNGAIYVYASTDNVNINNNLIKNNTTTGVKVAAATNVVINNNCIEGNNAGVTYSGAGTLDAENNWWGATDGPSGSGPGAGDSVGAGIDFTPFNNTSCGIPDIIDTEAPFGVPDGADDPLDIPVVVPACNPSNTFDTFSTGSVDGQGGWSATGPFDQAVVSNTYGYTDFGCQSLRISNAVTSGSFGDQTFTFSATNEAGETIADDGGFSSGTRQDTFEAEFDIAATQSTQQTGLALSVSPDRGDGSRMSYLSFTDTAGGIDVVFYDVQGTGNPANFVPTTVATGLSRTEAHTIKFDMEFVDGPSNDIVKIYIDGGLAHTGTSWENYYRYDSEQAGNGNKVPTTDSVLFRASGTAAPGNNGNGFLFDNVTIGTDSITPPVPGPTCDATNGDTSLLSYWKLDEGLGDTATNEVVGGADFDLLNNLEVGFDSNTPSVSFNDPYSLFFDGTDDTAVANEAVSLPTGGTVSFFFKPGSVTDNAYQYLVNAEYAGGGRITVIQRNGNLWFYWHTGGGPKVSASNVLTGGDIGVWKHVAMVNDNGTLYAYLDGVLLGSNTGAETGMTTTRVLLGSNITTSNAGFHFIGNLDDVRIYDRVLTNTEVSDLSGGDCQDSGVATYDFGDAPDPSYPTLLSNDGARHIIDSGVYLGSLIDDEVDGQQSAAADGDDANGLDDEDGVTFGMLMAGEMGTGTVVASTGGYLDAWVDFNNDGDWDDMYEQILDDEVVVAGSNSVIFPVPTMANVGNAFARFRFSTTTISTYTGEQPDGEVEDYVVAVSAPYIPLCNGLSATIYVDGNNKVVGGPLDGTVFAGTLTGTTGDDVIVGTSGDDTITGDDGADTICGGDGADDIKGNKGADTIFGEDGADILGGGRGADTVYGGEGNDTIAGFNGADTLYGDAGEDTINGDDGDDIIYGGEDNDTLYGKKGEDEIYGGAGNDYIEGNLDADMVKGGDGEDEIYGGFGDDFLCGDNDNDYIEGNDGADTICGSTGEDEIYGGAGDDQIDGGEDDDTIDGGDDTDICVNGEVVSTCEDTTTPVSFCEDKAACLPDDTTLVGYWRFDESSSASTAKDSSTYGNDGTYTGPVQSTDVPSLTYGNMFSRDFDGASNVVTVPSDSVFSFDTSNTFSVTSWVNADAFSGFQVVTHKIDDSNAARAGYMLVMNNGKPEVWIISNYAGGDYLRVEASGTLPTATWKQLGFTYDGSGLASGVHIFVDGADVTGSTLIDTLSGSILNTADFEIGGRSLANLQYFDGKIDDVRVYNRVVAPSEVSELSSGLCEDSGAISANQTVQQFGIHGGRHWKKNMVQRLNNLGNPNFVNAPTPPPSFGGPTYFGSNDELTWEQVTALCELHDNYDDLVLFDLVEFMAENFAHMFGITEEYALDMITNGTYCDTVEEAHASDIQIEEERLARIAEDKIAERFALLAKYKPEEVVFAVDSDGYPVSSDMIWNACIRNLQVFIDGEDKPVNCRRYHKGHTWEHPDTLMSFNWSDRRGAREIVLRERGYVVATQIVDTPTYVASNITEVRGGIVARRYALPMLQYLAQKGMNMLKQTLVQEDTETSVLSEETTIVE